MPATIRPASRLFNWILRHTLGAFVARRFHARYDAAVLDSLKPPYLIIGNHTCIWDPFLLSVPVRYPVHFVASDEYFRTPFMRFVFSLIGGIPKTKNTRDTQTVRTLLTLKRAGAVLGIYPEGNRNWDGVTGPLYGATAKLVRKLAIPVVLVKTTGGALTQPRWGRHWRNGWMKLSYSLLFTPEDCRAYTEQALLDQMVHALAHNDLDAVAEVAAQEGIPAEFPGKRLAERLELFLFQCPACRQLDTLHSCEDHLSCTSCGFSVRYGSDGQFHKPDTASETDGAVVPFAATHDWDRWQCANLAQRIKQGGCSRTECANPGNEATNTEASNNEATNTEPSGKDNSNKALALLVNDRALLQTGGRTGKLISQGRGSLSLFANRLRFDAEASGSLPISLPLSEISGLNIQYNNRIEFYRRGTLFRFSFPDAFISVWKWHQALLYAGVPGADAGDSLPAESAPPRAEKKHHKQEDPAI